ncbi:antibiotic biosynthesis monooxygenase [Shinella sp. CPCC 101442]|uniref:putative quinol monooxygenase n=1 Tax=Shinella sp. CPCC 101442 TaxID=2932265 RepID=UPI002152970A|nr:antibiotic biosynthesis monooxygenase [Shinella sp. CPCC 101442]MCR6500898.1 antibiotic biosynthesis monooxygenase [Shinella sp. CPCC 101442]
MADLDIDPAQLDAYKALLAEEIEASVRLEPGVLMLHAVALDEAPEKIRLLEVYADEAAYRAHLATPHFLKYKTLTAAMVRSLRLLPVTPIRMSMK